MEKIKKIIREELMREADNTITYQDGVNVIETVLDEFEGHMGDYDSDYDKDEWIDAFRNSGAGMDTIRYELNRLGIDDDSLANDIDDIIDEVLWTDDHKSRMKEAEKTWKKYAKKNGIK